MFKKSEKKNAVDLLGSLSKRAEDLSREEQAKSFVAIRRIKQSLESRDSRVIFGRRGTGKTHILSYIANLARDRQETACFIDLRRLGSNNSIYADHSVSPAARATTLIRDLLSAIEDSLAEQYIDPKSKLKENDFANALDQLQACVKSVVVTEKVEIREQTTDGNGEVVSGSVSARISTKGAEIGSAVTGERSTNISNEHTLIQTGSSRLSVNMGESHRCLSNVVSKLPGRFWLLLDEWSSIPEILQPFLADFIKRAIFPIQGVTVYIAAIEYRSKFRIDDEVGRIGFELGSDISADINLDDYFIYDVSPDAAAKFFEELLYNHLVAFAMPDGLVERNAKEVVNNVFSQEKVFWELVRASEGVARDFINILQLAAMRSDNSKIAMNEVRAAARDWFERDKQRNLDTRENAQELLQWIRNRVIGEKKVRAFLLNAAVSNPLIEFLFDERVLHIARRSYSAKDEPGVRYRVWKFDFGCYADLISTSTNPRELLSEGLSMSKDGEIVVPDDDYRAVRRAVLNLSEFEREHSAKVK